MLRHSHLMPGQLVELNEDISDAQASGYGLTCEDPRAVLKPSQKYEVSGVDLRRFSTGIYLLGVEGRFNSVCFHSVS